MRNGHILALVIASTPVLGLGGGDFVVNYARSLAHGGHFDCNTVAQRRRRADRVEPVTIDLGQSSGDNDIHLTRTAIVFTEPGDGDISVKDNRCSHISVAESESGPFIAAIQVLALGNVALLQNTIQSFGFTQDGRNKVGLYVLATGLAQINGNRLDSVGTAAPLGYGVAIEVPSVCQRASIVDNEVTSTPGSLREGWYSLRAGRPNDGDIIGAAIRGRDNNVRLDTRAGTFDLALERAASSLTVRGNRGVTSSAQPNSTVLISGFQICTFVDNHFNALAPVRPASAPPLSLVDLDAESLILCNNHLQWSGGGVNLRSVTVSPREAKFTILGNITTHEIFAGSSSLDSPWNALNVRLP